MNRQPLDSPPARLAGCGGFTAVEVIAVLVLVGILSAVVVSRVGNTTGERVAWTDQMKVHLRYAQSRAMNALKDNSWGIHFGKEVIGSHTYSYYRLFRFNIDTLAETKRTFIGVDTPDPAVFGAARSDYVFLPEGLDLQPVDVYFDSKGSPFPNNSLSLSAHINVVLNGATAITVTRETGFIE